MTQENCEPNELLQTEQFIKDRLQNDKTNFFGHAEQRQSIYDLLERSATFGESNIALLIGVRGSGKTSVRNTNRMLHGQSLRVNFCSNNS